MSQVKKHMARRQRFITTLARETGQTPAEIAASLNEAEAEGLIRWTRNGIQATIPEPEK